MSEPWAVPDSPAEPRPEPTVRAAGGGAVAGARARDVAGRGPEVPVPLRPLGLADRLDGALRILKLAPGTVLALAAAAVVPVQVLAALAIDDDGLGSFLAVVLGRPFLGFFASGSGPETLIALLLLVLEGVALSVVAAGTARLVTDWHLGRRPPTAEVLREVMPRLPALTGAWMLGHLAAVGFGLVLALPAVLPTVWFALAAPVIGVERCGPVAALRRSYGLARRRFGAVLITIGFVALVDLVLRVSLAALGSIYVDAELPGAWVVEVAFGIGVRMITVPFVAGASTLLYLDLRVRLEGLDIELAAADRFPVAP